MRDFPVSMNWKETFLLSQSVSSEVEKDMSWLVCSNASGVAQAEAIGQAFRGVLGIDAAATRNPLGRPSHAGICPVTDEWVDSSFLYQLDSRELSTSFREFCVWERLQRADFWKPWNHFNFIFSRYSPGKQRTSKWWGAERSSKHFNYKNRNDRHNATKEVQLDKTIGQRSEVFWTRTNSLYLQSPLRGNQTFGGSPFSDMKVSEISRWLSDSNCLHNKHLL